MYSNNRAYCEYINFYLSSKLKMFSLKKKIKNHPPIPGNSANKKLVRIFYYLYDFQSMSEQKEKKKS